MKKILNKYLPLAYGSYFNTLSIFSKKKAAEKAFTLFCTPRKGRVLEHQKEYLDNAKNELVTVNDLQLQTYKWNGNKETVLLLHGWESNAFRWRNLIEFLQKENYNVIAFDAPAHGNSSGTVLNVPLYTICTEKLITEYKPKFIIGHSVGGMTSIYNQYKNPNSSIEKIVSLGAPSELADIMSHYQKLLKFNSRVMDSMDVFFMEKFQFNIEFFSISKFAKNIKQKGLLIHDEFDTVAPFSASESVHKNWNNSNLIKTQGLGHSLHQEDVNIAIINFLKS